MEKRRQIQSHSNNTDRVGRKEEEEVAPEETAIKDHPVSRSQILRTDIEAEPTRTSALWFTLPPP